MITNYLNEYTFWNAAICITAITVSFILHNFTKNTDWKVREGQIVQVDVSKMRVRGNTNSSTGSINYKINLAYKYKYNGKEYEGTKIYPALPNIFSDKSDLDEFLTEYKKDGNANVYIDPEEPARSVLRYHDFSFFQKFVLFGFFSLIVSIILVAINFLMFPEKPIAIYLKDLFHSKFK